MKHTMKHHDSPLPTNSVAVFLISLFGICSFGAEKPNIVFVLLDDLGKEWVSCYGAKDIETPHFDQLAKQGIRFDNFYSMPQCTPTRVAFMTGQYPFRNGWVNHWDVPRWGGGCHFDWKKNPSVARVTRLRPTRWESRPGFPLL